jgi:hypothetical protein
MHDLDELRGLTGQIRQPSFEAIVATARRRRRRAIATVTALCAGFVVLVGGGALLSGTYDRPAPAVDEPPPGPMSPEGIVTGEASRLVVAAASPGDSDVRVALWEADCEGCGAPDGTWSTKSAFALTTDGFVSRTTYVDAPAFGVQEHPLAEEPRGPRIESPAKDLFLITDTMRPGEWLVGTDGTVQQVERVQTRLAPTDPRLWFRCHPAETPPAWDGYLQIDPAHLYPWCALDPDSATAYEWPARWIGSQVLPVSGEEPWGIDNLAQPTFAWWEVDGQRYRRFLADGVGDARGPVYNPPTGGPLFFTRFEYEPSMDLLEPGEGPDMQVLTRDAPGDRYAPSFDLMAGTPDGALLAVSTYPETMIWRTEDLDEGDFELVHESASPAPTQLAWVHEPAVVGDRIHVMTPVGVLVSEDDGRTWTEITTWR